MMNSTAPAAPSMWPVIDLVELTFTVFAASPKTALIAFVSLRSLAGVDVPCALMYSMSPGASLASFIARRIARCAPSPSGAGAVRWYASPVAP